MNRKPSLPPSKMPDVGTTIFTEMTALAQAHGALNVAQGFPDLPTPVALRQAAADAMEDGHNQYAPMPGNKALRTWIAEVHHAGAGYCPDTEITVGAGASSVLYAAMTALLQPGDEVVMQEPGYDLYAPVAELNFAKVVRVPLDDDQALHQAVGARTRIVVLNSPHNPTGKVLTAAQLDLLADAVEGTDAWVLSDEVYGPMVHDGREAAVPWRHPKLRDRTLVAGSFGKLFHATGWKIGWMAAPAELTRELRKVHQYDVFSTGAPFQEALARYLVTEDAKTHLRELGPIYQAKRDRLLQGLEGTAFTWQPAEGGYFQVLECGEPLVAWGIGPRLGDALDPGPRHRHHPDGRVWPSGPQRPRVLCERRPNDRRGGGQTSGHPHHVGGRCGPIPIEPIVEPPNPGHAPCGRAASRPSLARS